MCGIAGLALRDGTVDAARVRQMAAALAHRGPDDIGVYADGPVGIANTRLSIIDLDHGHQPLFAADGKLVLVANGEIYNYIELRERLQQLGHRFNTHSDCEVILHAYLQYGRDFLTHIGGMFAFALYDQRQRRLIAARDRIGIKPLFLAQLPAGIAFASELKALLPLLAGPPTISAHGLAQYLQNQFSTGATTILENVERVLPGEALCIEGGKITERWRYWTAIAIEPRELSYAQAEEEFDALMETTMRQHMRSDVPFGLFLSGGVDSSILMALLAHYCDQPVRTFSVGFRDSRPTDELTFAERTAERYGGRHTVLKPEPESMLQRLPFTAWAADDLMRDYANLPTALLAETAGRELKVVFSGEGGDEVFAGYGRYRASALERWVKGMLAPGSGGFRTRGTFRGSWPRRLFQPALLEATRRAREVFIAAWREAPGAWTDLQRMQYVDLTTALPDNLLVKADRMLMGFGVEGRVPFLDHRVVEFGLALPDQLKVAKGEGKVFLKRWAARLLPRAQLHARKRGFSVPVDKWFDDQLMQSLARLLPQHPAMRAWFHPAGLEQLVAAPRTAVVVRMLWALLQFAVWYTLFIERGGERPPASQDPLTLLAESAGYATAGVRRPAGTPLSPVT
jgi:asparagine synthase (glutamine-hydrolysing)